MLRAVDAAEHPVAVDVGVDEAVHAARDERADRGGRVELAGLASSPPSRQAAAHVDRHDDALAVLRERRRRAAPDR